MWGYVRVCVDRDLDGCRVSSMDGWMDGWEDKHGMLCPASFPPLSRLMNGPSCLLFGFTFVLFV